MNQRDYLAHDAVGLADLVRAGEVSAAEVLAAALERIEAVDGDIGAVVTPMFDAARAQLGGWNRPPNRLRRNWAASLPMHRWPAFRS